MGAILGGLLGLAIATWWRRRKVAARWAKARPGDRVQSPCALRHPDQDGSRWVHGSIEVGRGAPPVFTGNPDQITMRVEMPSSRFAWEGTRSGTSEVLSIAPGLVIATLRSASARIELALDPRDAEILSSTYTGTGQTSLDDEA